MKTTLIKKIEKDGDCWAVTFKLGRNESPEDFDFGQLGEDLMHISTFQDMAMFQGEITLKVGDSITDEKGGQPIIAAQHGKTEEKSFSIVKESDYRDAFKQKMTGEGEK